ncbi:hypothetical protein AQUSIP_09240 [Aquicella siphonis]|uniref:Uncharacterized protein n=1 Tax=Aquicella siphonis TaxID=254247 RepID=A0A5E4PFM0_9COXI|nr:hypothetical protein [Aquicella siphonis]VVC75634.1 hypothetical protein AQUSIP_09240 [Aquicella siphonis]
MKFKHGLIPGLAGLFWLISGWCGYAQAVSVITLPAYYQAACGDYTGTWQGFMTDPADLFGNGGPWPVTISLYHQDGRIAGSSSAVSYAADSGTIEGKRIWAQCQNGVLKNIFWGKKNACGSFSQDGALVSKNALVLRLNYENAMTGTNFLLFLQRKNNHYDGPVPAQKSDWILDHVNSCH